LFTWWLSAVQRSRNHINETILVCLIAQRISDSKLSVMDCFLNLKIIS